MSSGNKTTRQQHATGVLYGRLANNIERRRVCLGISRPALAKGAGETTNVVEKAEQGMGISVRALFAVADALGCKVDDLRSDS